jgi:4-hydroxy-3-methylbut-2-enyl diphosphate reductase
VIIPAFGTTLEIEAKLNALGIPTEKYNTTCPFVEKVWNRSEQIAKKGYTIVIHGKPKHEETRATFSHASSNAPSVIVNDIKDAEILAEFITGKRNLAEFSEIFGTKASPGFDPGHDLQRIGVKQVMLTHHNLTEENIEDRFADTRDTLCYATNDNQSAVRGMLETTADIAIVVGGYNSSNTTHLVELCEDRLTTFFIESDEKLISKNNILHFNYHNKQELLTTEWLPQSSPAKILVTSGASCPDAIVENVIRRIASFYEVEERIDAVIKKFQE